MSNVFGWIYMHFFDGENYLNKYKYNYFYFLYIKSKRAFIK